MLKYLVTSPSEKLLDDMRRELESKGHGYFDAVRAKRATADESDALGLTPEMPPETMDSERNTCLRVIGGNHAPDQIFEKLDKTSVHILEPEAIRAIGNLFPDVAFDVIIPYDDETQLTDAYRFDAIRHIDEDTGNFSSNITGALLVRIDKKENPICGLVSFMEERWTEYDNVSAITDRFLDLGLLSKNEDGELAIVTNDPNGKQERMYMPKDSFVTLQMDDEDKLETFLATWLAFERLVPPKDVKRPKIIILGRTGTGKTAVANKIVELTKAMSRENANLLKTVTTRPPRPNEDTYHFITKEQADMMPADSKCLRTFIGETEYFARKEDVERADIMVLDPQGLDEVMELYPDIPLLVVYVCTKKDLDDAELKRRGTDKKTYEKRKTDENPMFRQFELAIERFKEFYPYAPIGTIITEWENDFDQKSLYDFARMVVEFKRGYENLQCLYPVMGRVIGMDEPTPEETNEGASRLLLASQDMSDFMLTLIKKTNTLPIDGSFHPGPFKTGK